MKQIVNRRGSYRFLLNTPATLQLVYRSILNEDTEISEANSISEQVQLETVSFRGVSITFANDDFLYQFLDFIEYYHGEIFVLFTINETEFRFALELQWNRFYSLGEKNFYVSAGMLFNEQLVGEKKEELLDLLLSLDLDRVYLGHSVSSS
jgi:hypothetical protein